jgi:hypothetical protein
MSWNTTKRYIGYKQVLGLEKSKELKQAKEPQDLI